tara:strand:- start:1023 stop:1715 length:693 start_codon:yes stop_codon:yes gene_type:complete
MTYTLIIPIYNEERTLSTLLNKLYKISNHNIEIIIVDDGSNDNTKKILSKNDIYKYIRNKINKGKGASIKKGIESAKNQNIILIDGDLEIDIENIPRLIDKFERSKKDVLTGIRWDKNSNFRLEINTIGNYLINSLFNLFYSSNFNDVLCCVKILNKSLMKSLDIQSKGFSIEIETMAKLVLNKQSIEEIDITYNRRTKGEGKKLKISDSWGIIWTMIKIKFLTKSIIQS